MHVVSLELVTLKYVWKLGPGCLMERFVVLLGPARLGSGLDFTKESRDNLMRLSKGSVLYSVVVQL